MAIQSFNQQYVKKYTTIYDFPPDGNVGFCTNEYQ